MPEPRQGEKLGLAGMAAAALVVICCATGPLLITVVGSLAVGALAGIGAGLSLLVVTALTVLYLRRRSRSDKQASPVTLEVLYFEGCPGYRQILPTLGGLAAASGAELVQRRVETAERAQEERFLGSPSVRIDGRDIEPGAHTRTDYGLKCRLYRSPAGQSGLPPIAWIEQALQKTAPR